MSASELQLSLRRELLKLSKVQLVKRCKTENVSPRGNKTEMINRLIGTRPRKQSAAKPNKRKKTHSIASSSEHSGSHDQIDHFQLKPASSLKNVKHKKQNKKPSVKSSEKARKYAVYVIGGNHFGEFGLNHTTTLQELTKANEHNISQIYTGYQYTIYQQRRSQRFWSAGYNSYGQCAFNTMKRNEEWITACRRIEYFEQQHIHIEKLCCNISGSCSFWISAQNKVYAHGRNESGQLGLGHTKMRNKPTLVASLSSPYLRIVDIQSAHLYSVALVSMDNAISCIVKQWSRREALSSSLSAKHIRRIIDYCALNNLVYITKSSELDDVESEKTDESAPGTWSLMQCFEGHNIVKIRTGSEHTLFLQDNGSVWCVGDNTFGQCGETEDEEDERVAVPMEVEFFKQNGVCIVDIECGLYHNLAVSKERRVYSWGHAKRGQCGNGEADVEEEYIERPHFIEYFESNKLKVKKIACGNYHSLVATTKDEYYLFGSNKYHQCLCFDEQRQTVVSPFCVNEIVQQQTKAKHIKDIYLGCNNTKIIVY
eukprot:CAMPEP_0197032092 /NCGR_PEP_ID=MMETSP1384-20130603/10849_1 /TAXON_ID=29189 /ORGANISM="Ammonia sp." /LENGTH=539 /DNA_ID=CAMNT_0042461693 /DNA_START=32 /DNA_END=1651 /DNA_ORIENTATION=+